MKFLLGIITLCSMALSDINLPENFTADFTQQITNTKKKVIKYSGEVRFGDKKLFKWSYLKPSLKEVCTNGKEILVVDHDLEQVSKFYIDKGINIAKVIANAIHYKDKIYIAHFDGKKYTIQLDGKNKLQSIAYFDELDNKVQILFKHMKYKKGKISTKKMRCNYPVEYDIIRG